MFNQQLTERNAQLTELLKQAGLDSQARDVADRIQAVLTDEIHHRMKNMLTVVTALVRQSMRASANLADAEAAIGVRLVAMASAHDLLLKADWKATNLADVVQGAIQQHETAATRFTVAGTDIQITSAAILPLTLMLNELCTNAVKYGALSNETGSVAIRWSMDAAHLTLHWVESGGPPVIAPDRKNFGTKLIEQALPRQLSGTGQMFFEPSGVRFELVLPLDGLSPAMEIPLQKEAAHHE